MDIYEARRLVLERVIHEQFADSQAAFVKATGVSATYVSRMLAPAGGEKAYKRIGDDMAVRLEGVEALKLRPGALLNPVVKGRAEPASAPVDPAPPPDLVVATTFPDRVVIEVKSTRFHESDFTPGDLQELVDAVLDIPPRKARELLNAALLEQHDARRLLDIHLARASGTKIDRTKTFGAALPSTVGMPPPTPRSRRVIAEGPPAPTPTATKARRK